MTPPPLARHPSRSSRRAAFGSAAFFLVGPLLETVVGPWVLTGFGVGTSLPSSWIVRAVGFVVVVGGAAVLLGAFWRFVLDGVGTPSPLAPPQRLVVRGAYRYVRNPMYLATAAVVAGEALLLRQVVLLVAAAAYLATFAILLRVHEEPLLLRRFGAGYEAYRRAVPAWVPRLRPWRP